MFLLCNKGFIIFNMWNTLFFWFDISVWISIRFSSSWQTGALVMALHRSTKIRKYKVTITNAVLGSCTNIANISFWETMLGREYKCDNIILGIYANPPLKALQPGHFGQQTILRLIKMHKTVTYIFLTTSD